MRNLFSRTTRHALYAGILAALLVSTANVVSAKIVAIVYDDSGSMNYRKFLPAFGTTLLIATLDGNPGQDRLLTMSFSDFRNAFGGDSLASGEPITAENIEQFARQFHEPAYREEVFPSESDHIRVVTETNKRWSTVNGGTPYGALEAMLHALADESSIGEKIYFIFVTDGQFEEAFPDPETARNSMRLHRQRIPGIVTAAYLQILPSGYEKEAAELKHIVQNQGIRKAILEEFNGDSNEGSFDVDSDRALWNALREIISTVAATDRARQGKYIDKSENEVRINTPFPVKRIISVSTSPSGNEPQVSGTSFDAMPASVSTRMLGRDTFFEGVNYSGTATHFRFTPPLNAGNHSISFDRNVGDDVFLLFDAALEAELFLLRADDNTEIQVNASGERRLEAGDTYTVGLRIRNPVSGELISFSDLPSGTQFTNQVNGPTPVSRSSNMQRNDSENRAESPFISQTLGKYELTAVVDVPGFVTLHSGKFEVIISSSVVDLSLESVSGLELCSDCEPDQIAKTVSINGTGGDVASFEVVAEGELNQAALEFSSGGTSEFLKVVDDTGKQLNDGDKIPIAPGEPLTLTVQWDQPVSPSELPDINGKIDFILTPTDGARGEPLSIHRRLRVVMPEAVLELERYTRGDPTTGAMKIGIQELRNGLFGAQFRLENALELPKNNEVSANFIDPKRTLIDLRTDVEGNKITVVPHTKYFCLCFIGIYSRVLGENRLIVVQYNHSNGLQSAKAELTFEDDLAEKFPWLSCILNLFYLFLATWLIWSIIAIFRTRRFPRRSIALIQYGTEDFSRRRQLRGRNFTFPRVLLSPIIGPPHEISVVEGLKLRATHDGAEILIGKRPPNWILDSSGETLDEIWKMNPEMKTIQFTWSESLKREFDKMTVTLMRDSTFDR